ncbi:MAG: hypothetical protein WCS89_04470 [Candidatus Paceibacterota bacterium]|jgi:hypothetical protein
MSTGVEFEEDSFGINPVRQQSSGGGSGFQSPSSMYPGYSGGEEKGMAGWLMRHNIVKSPQGAQVVLVGIVIINIIITVVSLTFFL